jgi:crotonobetainyl-CoA:carnitine CoA-transferase CaiB-like acyl-CoA transferase
MMGALSDLRVIDASRILAGPFCGQMFAEQGAEVIKIEPPEGDPNRGWPLMINGWSTNFLSVNRGKKSVTLNLRSDRGRALFYDLIRHADVLIHNYLPVTAQKLGVDDEKLEEINPRLVRVVLTGYGEKGALSNKAGYDTMITAYSGIMSLTGEKDRSPVKPGVSAVDLAAGAIAFGGALSALHSRDHHPAGKGQRVNVSLLEMAVTLLGFHGLNWLQGGQIDGREGANYGPLVPFGRYRAQDADIMIGASTQEAWLKICAALGGGLAEDHRYATNALRCQHDDELRVDIEALLAARPVGEWVVILDEAGAVNAPIQTVDQVMQDPQVLVNEMVVEAKGADGSSMRLLGLPFKLSRTPGDATVAPPLLGDSTEEVLQRLLKLPSEQIQELREQRVI